MYRPTSGSPQTTRGFTQNVQQADRMSPPKDEARRAGVVR